MALKLKILVPFLGVLTPAMLEIVFTTLQCQKLVAGFQLATSLLEGNWGCEAMFSVLFFDEDSETDQPLDPDEPVYICFKGMPMGWSWALWLSQEIVSFQCLKACGYSDDSLVRDKNPPPPVMPGQPPLGIYVDNVHAFAGKSGDASSKIEAVKLHFERLGIPFEVDAVDGQQQVESLGLCFSFTDRVRVRAKKDRAWRLWAATRALLKRKRISGETLRLWLGHVNFHFLLARPLLSVLSACYKFAATHLGHRYPMWNSVRAEMKAVLGLIFIVEADLSRPVCCEVHVGDSSDRGFSLMSCHSGSRDVRAEMRFSEKWRFIKSDEPGFFGCNSGCPDVQDHDRHDSCSRGTAANAGCGHRTKFGLEVEAKLRDTDTQRLLKRKKKTLFGKLEQRERSMIEARRIPPISEKWRNVQQWDLVVAKAWQNPLEHINVKEARVALMAIRRLCRTRRNLGNSCLVLSDSMVTIMALSKGRSSSRPLNTICRRAAAYIVGANLGIHLRHIVSADNPADGPSRWFGDDFIKKGGIVGNSLSMGVHHDVVSFEHGKEVPIRHSPLYHNLHHQGPVGFLELFAGTGNLTHTLKRRGLRVLPHFEFSSDKIYDLLNPKVQNFVLGLIASGVVWWVHLGSPCTAWSRARHNIKNIKEARRKELEAVATALFSVRVILECLKKGVVFTLENPLSSRLWDFLPLQQLATDKRVGFVVFDMCQFQEPYKKPTKIMTNENRFNSLAKICRGGHKHNQLKGTIRVKIDGQWRYKNRTALAGAYGSAFCEEWAGAAELIAPPSAFGVLSWKQRYEFIEALSEAANSVDAAAREATSVDSAEDGARGPFKACSPLQEAKTFWRNNPVVFGQYKKEQIEAELRKLRKAKRCQKETKNRQKPKDSEGRFGWPSVAPQPSAPGPESWATYSDKIPTEY